MLFNQRPVPRVPVGVHLCRIRNTSSDCQ